MRLGVKIGVSAAKAPGKIESDPTIVNLDRSFQIWSQGVFTPWAPFY